MTFNVRRLSLQPGYPLLTTVWDAKGPFFRHITADFDGRDLTLTYRLNLRKASSLRLTFIEGPKSHNTLPHLFARAFETLCHKKLCMHVTRRIGAW